MGFCGGGVDGFVGWWVYAGDGEECGDIGGGWGDCGAGGGRGLVELCLWKERVSFVEEVP